MKNFMGTKWLWISRVLTTLTIILISLAIKHVMIMGFKDDFMFIPCIWVTGVFIIMIGIIVFNQYMNVEASIWWEKD